MLVKNWHQKDKLKQQATRAAFGEALLSLGRKDKNIVALCADLTGSLNMDKFQEAFPERFIEVGVAEQNMAGVAAGLALSGKTAFMGSFATFTPGRNWEQIRVSICYNQANVKVIGSHAGLAVGEDGATHQGTEDIAITRCLPNMIVISPADALEAKKATFAIAQKKGPAYLRLSRAKTPIFTHRDAPFKIGKAQILVLGKDVAIIGCGPILYDALMASYQLKNSGINAGVVNYHTIKPIDEKTIVRLAKSTGAIVTVEDHQIHGGLGSAVAEVLVKHCPVPQEFIAINDSFGESGKPEQLFKKYNLTSRDIIKAVRTVLKRKL